MNILLIDPITASLIVAGISAGAGAYTDWRNRKRQEKQNTADRQFQTDMYEKTKADSRTDWDKMNQYNSPQQQMQRLREAGLNPHMVYGKGADNTAVMIKSGTPGSGSLPAPQGKDSLTPAMIAGTNALTQYQQVKQSQAQTDNLVETNKNIQAQTVLAQKEAAKKDLEMANLAANTARSQFDLSLAKELKDNTMQSAILQNKMLEANINITNNRDLREKNLNTAQIQEITQRTLLIKKDIAIKQFQIETQPLQKQKLEKEIAQLDVAIANSKKDGIFKDWENSLAKKGLTKNDPYALRILENTLTSITPGSTFKVDEEHKQMYIDKIHKFQQEYHKKVMERYNNYRKQ